MGQKNRSKLAIIKINNNIKNFKGIYLMASYELRRMSRKYSKGQHFNMSCCEML